MRRDALRALQAPLEQRYRNEPAAAQITLSAEGRLGEDIACRVETGRALVEAGLRQIRLSITIDSDAGPENRRKLLELSERYCVVYQIFATART